MTRQFSIRATAPGAATTIASLPLSFAQTTARPDVVLIDGSEDWLEQVCSGARAGARAAVVIEPTTFQSGRSAPIPVVVDTAYAGNPSISAIRQHVSAVETGALLEVRAIMPTTVSAEQALRSLLSVIRATTDEVLVVPAVPINTAHGFTVQGTLSDGREALITLTKTNALPERVTVRVVGARTTVEAAIPAASVARPAVITVSEPDGAIQLPTLWETSHRAALRRVREVLVGADVGDDLSVFAADAELAHQLLKPAQTT